MQTFVQIFILKKKEKLTLVTSTDGNFWLSGDYSCSTSTEPWHCVYWKIPSAPVASEILIILEQFCNTFHGGDNIYTAILQFQKKHFENENNLLFTEIILSKKKKDFSLKQCKQICHFKLINKNFVYFNKHDSHLLLPWRKSQIK